MFLRSKGTTIAAIVALLSFSAIALQKNQAQPSAQSQQSQEPFKFSLHSNLVLLPVMVTDKKGKHVDGLTMEDFEIKEDGKVQKIVHLDEINADSGTIQAPSQTASAFTNRLAVEHPKKMEIIAIDQVNTPFTAGADARRGIVQFLSKNVDANTLLALVAFQHNGVRLLHNFTSDPAVLVAAVRKVQSSLTSRDTRALDISGDTSEADAEALQIQAALSGVELSGAVSTAQAVSAARAAISAGEAQVDLSRQGQEGLITLECLQQAAEYFGGVPGRKSLIWASSGFPFALGASAKELTRGTTIDDWQRTFDMLQDANIAVYPVDVSGLVTGGSANNVQSLNSNLIKAGGPEGGVAGRSQQLDQVTAGTLVDPTEARHETMRHLADITGGEAFYNSNSGAELFRRAGEDSAQYYQLAYYTKDNGKYGWRKLSVKVREKGVKVRARSGFVFHDPAKDTEQTRQFEETMALDSDLTFASLPFKGEWTQVEQAGNERKVHFRLSIPAGVPSIDTDHQNHFSMDFRIVAANAAGQVAGTIGQRLDTKLPPEAVAQVERKGLDYDNTLTLPPGVYKVHFVVHDNLRGTLGSVVVPLTVE